MPNQNAALAREKWKREQAERMAATGGPLSDEEIVQAIRESRQDSAAVKRLREALSRIVFETTEPISNHYETVLLVHGIAERALEDHKHERAEVRIGRDTDDPYGG